MRLALPVLAAALLLAGTAFHTPSPALARPDANGLAVDTLRLSVTSGEPLVTLLPGEDDVTFRVLRAPALSWLVGRSFYWKTLPAERGREYVLIERSRGDVVRDTLVVVVEVGPR